MFAYLVSASGSTDTFPDKLLKKDNLEIRLKL